VNHLTYRSTPAQALRSVAIGSASSSRDYVSLLSDSDERAPPKRKEPSPVMIIDHGPYISG
jgi:hypothetical protein